MPHDLAVAFFNVEARVLIVVRRAATHAGAFVATVEADNF
jgi:hypothetical protein